MTVNYAGTDYTGTLDRGNAHDGIYIGEGAHDNIIDGNLISGNDFKGVCVIGYPPFGWDSHDKNTEKESVMSLLKGMNERAKNFKIWDIKLAQGAAMCVMLIIAKLIPQILEISIWWLVVLAILLGIRPMYLFLHK